MNMKNYLMKLIYEKTCVKCSNNQNRLRLFREDNDYKDIKRIIV